MKKGFPICDQRRTDCAMYNARRCIALTRTYFDRPCPFYKPAEAETADGPIRGRKEGPIEIREGGGAVYGILQ